MASDISSSAAHIRKRQYQPSATSTLLRSESAPEKRVRSPLSPALPPETQSSLMNVGMRVRKAVPEGYKTHKTLGADGFPFASTAPAAIGVGVEGLAYSNGAGSMRELQPFCGLHKVGGWAQQENVPPQSSMTAFTIAAPTVSTSASAFAMSTNIESRKKRSYDDDVEDKMDAFFDGADMEDATASLPQRRPIAKPRASLKRTTFDSGVFMGEDEDDDFEEATFLAPMDVDAA
ncbi:Ribonucleotide reductase inhibitor [Teratosphaeria destructans]|uniref:Ribonucleotide reductase inhibitor n=1 Tax=Teratosphaeria destructans TaxID=418781 RepID=A0A9W7W227_9PEZI|nr:Ribonucleotide reductase inhibitor [Teratosphaeria destructans]